MPVRGVDARIPLGVTMPPPIDPFASLGKILELKDYQEQSEERSRKRAKEQQFDAIAQQYGDDPEEFVRQISRVDPEAGAKISKLYAETRTAKFSAYEKQLDGETKGLELATRELQAIPDGDVPTAAAWRSRWVSRDPQLDKILPTPDALATPDVKQQVLGLGISTVEFNKAKAEGVKAFIAGDYRKGLGNTLAVAPSLEAAKATIEEAKRAVPKSAQGDIALFETLLVNADGLASFQAAAGNAALSEKERLDVQGKQVDDQRQADAAAETRRHNQVTEGTARGQLAVAQKRLAQDGSGVGTVKPGDTELVKGIIANPGLYAGITPTTKERLIGPLMAAGFTGFAAGQTGKPPTGAQNRALNFFNRAKQAADELERLDVSGLNMFGQAWINKAPNVLQSQLGQQYNAAASMFTEARLRKDSGAAIPPHEYEADRKTNFQQAGDSDTTLAQKKRGRAAILASLAYEAGPALHGFYGEEADEILGGYKEAMNISGGGQQQQRNASAPASPKVGDVVSVRGQRVKVTRLLPNGKYEGDVVP